jgi:DNA-binding CsgD family transcriptional regulator
MAPSSELRIIGRDAELIRFAGWARDLRAGHGRAVLVEGEPGIGKTALVRQACDSAADDGCRVFWGAGDELGTPLLLSPLLEALAVSPTADAQRRSIAGLLSGSTAAKSSDELVTAIGEQIVALVGDAAFAAPAILVVEDLQWCDAATLAVWSRLGRVAAELPLLLIGTLRQPPRDGRVLALERIVGSGGRLRLGPLAEEPVAELVAALCGGVPDPALLELADGAAGNPLYLTELFDALDRDGSLCRTDAGLVGVTDGSVPRTLTAAIDARLGVLPHDVRQVLRMAALLGADFSVADLAAVSGRGPEQLATALQEARDAGILSGGEPGFRHPMLRTALYEDLPPELRVAWHRDAAAALARDGAAPERVARQLLPAVPAEDGDEGPAAGAVLPAWVAPWLVDAVPVLLVRAPQTTVKLLRAILRQLPEVRRSEPAARLAAALVWTGATAEAESVALRHLPSASSPGAAVDLLWTLSQCYFNTGRAAESLPLIGQALLRQDLTPTHRARLLALRARVHHHLGKIGEGHQIAESALVEASAVDDDWATGWALHVLTISALMRGAVNSSLPLFARALSVTEHDPGLADLRLLLHVNHAVALGNLDRYDDAITAARHVCELTERAGSARQAQVRTVLGELLMDTGRWDEALLAVTAVPDDLKDPAGACVDLGVAAAICLHRGDSRTAGEYLAAADRPAQMLGGRVVRSLALAQSLDAEASGDPVRALATLLAGLADEAEELEEIEGMLPDAVRIAVDLEELETARDVAMQVEWIASQAETPHYLIDVTYCRGLVGGDVQLLLEAEERYRELGRVLNAASAARAAGSALAEAGNRPAARAAFGRALAVYDDLEATWDIAALSAQMRRLGIRRGPHARHRTARHGWEGLTPSEVKVVDLVVKGLSNTQIGAELFLSPRTVETHVSHVLAKLGLRSRVDIVREAGRRVIASEPSAV